MLHARLSLRCVTLSKSSDELTREQLQGRGISPLHILYILLLLQLGRGGLSNAEKRGCALDAAWVTKNLHRSNVSVIVWHTRYRIPADTRAHTQVTKGEEDEREPQFPGA